MSILICIIALLVIIAIFVLDKKENVSDNDSLYEKWKNEHNISDI